MRNDGKIKVFASIFGSKVKKSMNYYLDSIIVIRFGSSSGDEGPVMFLCIAKENSAALVPLRGGSIDKDLLASSLVVGSPATYFVDGAQMECDPHVCKGIRKMEITKDHQD